MSHDKKYKHVYDKIKVLDPIQAIRQYSKIYIGETDQPFHLVIETISNATDEYRAQYCTEISVSLISDKTIIIKDNGRGIPIGVHGEYGEQRSCELVFLTIHSGSKFNLDGDTAYKNSGGLHGIGLSAVNALSENLYATIIRDGVICKMEFLRGKLLYTKIVDNIDNLENGTTIQFTPDNQIFDNAAINSEDLYDLLDCLIHFNKGLVINYKNEITGYEEKMVTEKGISGLMHRILKDDNRLFKENFHIQGSKGNIQVEIFINWSSSDKNVEFISGTNSIKQKDGGSHVSGVKYGIIKFLSGIKEINEILESNIPLTWNDVKSGFRLIIHLEMPNPEFDSQTKHKLSSNVARKRIEEITYEYMLKLYQSNPNLFYPIIKQVCNSILRKQNADKDDNKFSAFLYEGKFIKPQVVDPKINELILTEGQSAGGSAARVKEPHQAVMVMDGKILNVYKQTRQNIMKSPTLSNIVDVIGGKYNFDGTISITEIKFIKIIVLADADVDGDHIKALLLAWAFKQVPSILDRMYISVPPLFRIQMKDDRYYFNKQSELINFLERYIINKYFANIELIDNEKVIIRKLVSTLHKHYKNINNFTVKIIDSMINKNLWKFSQIFDNFDIFAEELTKLYTFIYCYINNTKEKIIIEDYYSISKEVLTAESFKDKIEFITSIFQNYTCIKEFSKKIFSKYGHYLFSYFYRSWDSMQSKCILQRFKGLGEMNPDQLYHTSIRTKSRKLRKIVLEDIQKAEKICNMLMGDKPSLRREFVDKYCIFDSSDV